MKSEHTIEQGQIIIDNEVTIDEILGSGVLNYKLETATETATKSMIILE